MVKTRHAEETAYSFTTNWIQEKVFISTIYCHLNGRKTEVHCGKKKKAKKKNEKGEDLFLQSCYIITLVQNFSHINKHPPQMLPYLS